jgi:hypothetical protein
VCDLWWLSSWASTCAWLVDAAVMARAVLCRLHTLTSRRRSCRSLWQQASHQQVGVSVNSQGPCHLTMHLCSCTSINLAKLDCHTICCMVFTYSKCCF